MRDSFPAAPTYGTVQTHPICQGISGRHLLNIRKRPEEKLRKHTSFEKGNNDITPLSVPIFLLGFNKNI
jgi:hypothetical protein